MSEKPLVDWGCSCGRHCLIVAGYIVAVEGDPIRDDSVFALQGKASKDLEWKGWDGEAIKAVCAAANKVRTAAQERAAVVKWLDEMITGYKEVEHSDCWPDDLLVEIKEGIVSGEHWPTEGGTP